MEEPKPHLTTKQKREIVTFLTDSHSENMSLDSEAADDALKYSTWLLAVATAGIAISLTQADQILSPDGPSGISRGLLDLASVSFLASALIGAAVKQLAYRQKQFNRKRVALISAQTLRLRSDEGQQMHPDLSNSAAFYSAFIGGSFLEDDQTEQLQRWVDSSHSARLWGSRCLGGQQVLTLAGYILMFTVSLL